MSLRSLLDQAIEAQTFEALAEKVLGALLALADAGLTEKSAKLQRAMVHLRPDGGYRGLAVMDASRKLVESSPETRILSSATAWRLVEHHSAAVEIDVQLAIATIDGQEIQLPTDPDGGDSFSSQHRLLDREATHILALPLRSSRGRTIGMTSIEVGCLAAVGGPSLFEQLIPQALMMVDVVAPRFEALPLAEAELEFGDPLLPVVGRSMKRTIRLVSVFASQPETILVLGPTGAGKSRLAKWCHSRSPRSEKPFESVDLMTVPEEMQMAELFGWKKGAFTGAVSDHDGYAARAEGGTLFIDEIDKLSLKAQAGLLSFLESREYRRLGDPGRAQKADVRLVIGTNADLKKSVESGEFREDLYYRINVLPVQLPALADRADEIPAWGRFMAQRRHEEAKMPGDVSFSDAAALSLCGYDWPGNLRQLDNIVRRAYAIALADMEEDGPVSIHSEHVERSMAFERGGHENLAKHLNSAACAIAAEAQRRFQAGTAVDLDLIDGFRGFVISASEDLLGGRDEAFRMLGKASAVQSRNHHKIYKRELGKAEELCSALGLKPLKS